MRTLIGGKWLKRKVGVVVAPSCDALYARGSVAPVAADYKAPVSFRKKGVRKFKTNGQRAAMLLNGKSLHRVYDGTRSISKAMVPKKYR